MALQYSLAADTKNGPMLLPGRQCQVPCFKGYYAVVCRQQCSPIGLAHPEPRPQPYKISLGRIGSPGEGSSGAAKIHYSTHRKVAREMATNPRGCPAHTPRGHARQVIVDELKLYRHVDKFPVRQANWKSAASKAPGCEPMIPSPLSPTATDTDITQNDDCLLLLMLVAGIAIFRRKAEQTNFEAFAGFTTARQVRLSSTRSSHDEMHPVDFRNQSQMQMELLPNQNSKFFARQECTPFTDQGFLHNIQLDELFVLARQYLSLSRGPGGHHEKASGQIPCTEITKVLASDSEVRGLNPEQEHMCETYRFPTTNKTPPHYILTSLTSATYCTMFIFWVHLQEGLDVTTSDVYTNTVPTYHVLVNTIINAWKSKIRRSHNRRQGWVNVHAKQSGHRDLSTVGQNDCDRILPVGPHEGLDLPDLCGIRGRTAGSGYGCGGSLIRYSCAFHMRNCRYAQQLQCSCNALHVPMRLKRWYYHFIGEKFVARSREPMKVKLGENGAAPKCKGGGRRRSRKNPLPSGIVRHNSRMQSADEDTQELYSVWIPIKVTGRPPVQSFDQEIELCRIIHRLADARMPVTPKVPKRTVHHLLRIQNPWACTLIFDGAFSHLDANIVHTADANDITLFCLPSNTTHEIKPMDESVLKSYEVHWGNDVILSWTQHTHSTATDIEEVSVDREIRRNEAFAPSELTHRPEDSTEVVDCNPGRKNKRLSCWSNQQQAFSIIISPSWSDVLYTPGATSKKNVKTRKKATNYRAQKVMASLFYSKTPIETTEKSMVKRKFTRDEQKCQASAAENAIKKNLEECAKAPCVLKQRSDEPVKRRVAATTTSESEVGVLRASVHDASQPSLERLGYTLQWDAIKISANLAPWGKQDIAQILSEMFDQPIIHPRTIDATSLAMTKLGNVFRCVATEKSTPVDHQQGRSFHRAPGCKHSTDVAARYPETCHGTCRCDHLPGTGSIIAGKLSTSGVRRRITVHSVSLDTDDHLIIVWRHPVQRRDLRFTIARHTVPTREVSLYEFLRPCAVPFLAQLGNPIFQQDKVRSHTARESVVYLRDVNMLPLPDSSPDLSSIESF
ncbi:hypothetical protein PR048_008867 [Dryococelus australis]|uniref:DDE-1 domain-containing protein n=1 Tax=Dryococelus australis TaxID=614101 RepID=A0ABQ9HYA6_9NEOP|nr:hypothetical protein PR048_008867 [Dryococelus australis]